MLRKSWFIVLVVVLFAVFLSACGENLTGSAGAKATFEECKQEIGSDKMKKKCEEFFAAAFQEGNEEVLFDYAACLSDVLASDSTYCQYLIEQGQTHGVTVEGCRGLTGTGNVPCEYFTDRMFPAVYEPLMRDYQACEDEVLALGSPYCDYLMGLALAYGLGFDVCRWEYDNATADAPPKIECGQFLDQYFARGNYSIVYDFKACEDGILAEDGMYCQFLLALGRDYSLTFDSCHDQFNLHLAPAWPTCYTYFQRLYEVGDETVVRDQQACEDEILAAEAPYCQFLLTLNDFSGISHEECRAAFDLSVDGPAPSASCYAYLDTAFKLGFYNIIVDYKACQDAVLADDMPYCQYLFELGASYSVSFEGCRTQISLSADGGPEPLNACYTYLYRLSETENTDLLFDIQACKDEVLAKEMPYCQFILSLEGEG